jgi:hypothetical protein
MEQLRMPRRTLFAAGAFTIATSAASRAATSPPPRHFGYVCSYTSVSMPGGAGHGEGITLVRIDPQAG